MEICFKNEMNFRIHFIFLLAAISLGCLFHINTIEWLFIVAVSFLVIVLEMINTAIEQLCNIVSTEFHPLIKIIKDVSAGAVLLSAIASLVIGGIIFLPKIYKLFT